MVNNVDLFEEEIDNIREFSELDMETFHDVLNCTRGVVEKFGNSISPISVVDVIEGAVGHLIDTPAVGEKLVTVEEAVEMAISNLHFSDEDEMDDMFEDGIDESSDEYDTGKIRH